MNFENLETPNIEFFEAVFKGCENLETLNMPYINTERVVSFKETFSGLNSLKDFKYIEKLKTAKIENLEKAFYGSESLKSLDLSKWDISSVNNIESIFEGCKNLETLTLGNNQNEIITYTTKAFKGCEKLTSLDLSKISTSKTVNMVEMFSNTLALQKLDIRNFSDNVEGNYEKMFENINNGKEMTVIIDEEKCQKISKSLPDYVKKEKPTNS